MKDTNLVTVASDIPGIWDNFTCSSNHVPNHVCFFVLFVEEKDAECPLDTMMNLAIQSSLLSLTSECVQVIPRFLGQ